MLANAWILLDPGVVGLFGGPDLDAPSALVPPSEYLLPILGVALSGAAAIALGFRGLRTAVRGATG